MGAGGAAGAAASLQLRPGQRGAVGVGRIGGGEQQEGAVGFGQRAQALDRAGEGELGAAEALDEVAAAGGAEQLEVAELRVEGGEAAGDALGQHGLAGDDAVALQHQLGLGAQAGTRAGSVGEEWRGEGPAALDRGGGGAAAGEAAATLAT